LGSAAVVLCPGLRLQRERRALAVTCSANSSLQISERLSCTVTPFTDFIGVPGFILSCRKSGNTAGVRQYGRSSRLHCSKILQPCQKMLIMPRSLGGDGRTCSL